MDQRGRRTLRYFNIDSRNIFAIKFSKEDKWYVSDESTQQELGFITHYPGSGAGTYEASNRAEVFFTKLEDAVRTVVTYKRNSPLSHAKGEGPGVRVERVSSSIIVAIHTPVENAVDDGHHDSFGVPYVLVRNSDFQELRRACVRGGAYLVEDDRESRPTTNDQPQTTGGH